MSAVRFTDWFRIDVARVRGFAEVTEDWQAIHLDADYAATSPFGGCVAHGFLTLAMLSAMSYQVTAQDRMTGLSVNYGFDRVRFVSPVPVGARVRGRFAIADETIGPGWRERHWDVTIEIENEPRPALVAHWITRLYEESASGGAAGDRAIEPKED